MLTAAERMCAAVVAVVAAVKSTLCRGSTHVVATVNATVENTGTVVTVTATVSVSAAARVAGAMIAVIATNASTWTRGTVEMHAAAVALCPSIGAAAGVEVVAVGG